MEVELLKEVLKEVKELRREVNLLRGIKVNTTEGIDKPKDFYKGKIVEEMFSKFYKKVESGLINSRQEEFGRSIYNFYADKNYLSTKQFDSMNNLVKDVRL